MKQASLAVQHSRSLQDPNKKLSEFASANLGLSSL